MNLLHLRGAGADVVLDTSTGVPAIVHWGAPLGDVDPASVVTAAARTVTHGSLDVIAPVTVVPEHGSGWQGRPGLAGNRPGGRAWSPRFTTESVRHDGTAVEVDGIDPSPSCGSSPASSSTRCSSLGARSPTRARRAICSTR
jgi:alpha-galactosidase